MRAIRFAPAILLAATAHCWTQQTGQNAPFDQEGTYRVSVRSQLVVETVSVQYKNGKPVDGLTAKDFKLTEDGVEQKIKFCEFQQFPMDVEALPANTEPKDLKLYNKLLRAQISPEQPGSDQYKNKRLLVLYFDMTSLAPVEQQRSYLAATDFIRKHMTPADLIAIMRYRGGSMDVLQDFTSDRSRLMSIISTLSVGEGQGNDEMASDAASSDTGAAFGEDNSEFNIFNTDRQLSALQMAVRMLGQLREKKMLIYFASGMQFNSISNQAQLSATEQAAVKAGVSLWPIDARGLIASAPLGDATLGSPGNLAMYNGESASALGTRLESTQDALFALGADTGGKAMLDNNDLALGIVQAQQSETSYYVLGYYPTNQNLDGRFRRIRVTVDTPLSAKLDFRQGYFADKVFAKFTAADKEQQLEDALKLGDPITDLTIAMEINYFQINSSEYFVPITIKIPGDELALAKQHGAEHSLIDFIGEIKDIYANTTVTNVRDKVNIALSDATAQELGNRPIEYDTGFTLLPGKYSIKFLARDDETGRIGTYQALFTIPNLNKQAILLPISSVVLSSQKAKLQDALFNTEKQKALEKDLIVHPLVQDGTELIPSVTRVFSKRRDFYVYLQAYAYPKDGRAQGTLVGFVSLYKDPAEVFETKPVRGLPTVHGTLVTLPLSFALKLDSLPTGSYICQVTVVDPMNRTANIWRAPILVVP